MSPKTIYYQALDGSRAGPVDIDELAALAKADQVTDRTLVYNDALSSWVPIQDQEALYRGILRRIDPNYVETNLNDELIEALHKAGVPPETLPSFFHDGGRIVSFRYTFSVVVLSFFRSTGYQIIKPGQSTFSQALPHCVFSLLLGWWGFPWGPIFTLQALITNLSGGQNHMPAILVLPESAELVEMEEARLRKHKHLAMFIPFTLFVLLMVWIAVWGARAR